MKVREQFLGAIAFAGDLTMGQPPEHSPKTACLAAKIAHEDGASHEMIARSAQLAMIRWSGCTANAGDFADFLGDDIIGRREVLAARDPFVMKTPTKQSLFETVVSRLPFFPKASPEAIFYGKVTPLVYTHCEVASEIARRAGFSSDLVKSINELFEYWDGSGWPHGKRGSETDPCVQYVWLANDIEAFCRFHGFDEAERLIRSRGNVIYSKSLANQGVSQMQRWLSEFNETNCLEYALGACALPVSDTSFDLQMAVELLADFADLKRPHLLGVSRKASKIALDVAEALNLAPEETVETVQGTLLSSLGYVAVTSTAFNSPEKLNDENSRLVPYWSERILSRAQDLSNAARVASHVFERLDGTGWHRGLRARDLPTSSKIAQVALSMAEYELSKGLANASDHLVSEAKKGRLDASIVNVALKLHGEDLPTTIAMPETEFGITAREREVLLQVIEGKSNKEIARLLNISPKTVGSHLENCFRKMEVTTRAAAAIKALNAGIVS